MPHDRIITDPARVYAAASRAPCDHRIAKRALERGVDTITIPALRNAVARAIAETEPARVAKGEP